MAAIPKTIENSTNIEVLTYCKIENNVLNNSLKPYRQTNGKCAGTNNEHDRYFDKTNNKMRSIKCNWLQPHDL